MMLVRMMYRLILNHNYDQMELIPHLLLSIYRKHTDDNGSYDVPLDSESEL